MELPVEVVKCISVSLPEVAEQVIEVPKLALLHGFFQRVVLFEPQTAEQLVEVPTVLSPALLQQQVEQIVDNPALLCRGARGGLPGFLPGQDLQRSVEQIVDPSVPGRGGTRGLQGFHPRQRPAQRTVEQTVDIPVPGRGAPGDRS